ncbi:MAG: isoprenylcysteine carboxylmethyltransferase family protein [Ktedonobacteraceae bacterium]
MDDNLADNPGVIAPPPLIYAGGLATGLLLYKLFPLHFLPRGRGRALFGGALIGIAVTVARLAFGEMRRARTNIDPRQPATTIVVSGPFQFTRNPLYLSLTLLYSGIAVLANALWAMLLLPVVLLTIRFGVIEREEQYLERKFGEQYLSYKSSVRRWI